MPLHQDIVRRQIDSLARPSAPDRLTAYLAATCWPGGGSDRTLAAAAAWVRGWRPERSAIDLVACTCATGRCRICN